jgi:acyl transferase domain-containing protein
VPIFLFISLPIHIKLFFSHVQRAEGFGAVLVKRLDKAIAEGDHVYSIITGSSINSNGKGTTPTMPDGGMQVETISEAYSRAKRNPSDAFYAELHATGTSVGDPIEANAAGSVFSKGRNSRRPLR